MLGLILCDYFLCLLSSICGESQTVTIQLQELEARKTSLEQEETSSRTSHIYNICPSVFSNHSGPSIFQSMGEAKHDTYVCSCFKSEQRLCIIQSDTDVWHIDQGNWRQNCLQIRLCQLPQKPKAHCGHAVKSEGFFS